MDRENRARNWASLLKYPEKNGIFPTENSKIKDLVQGYSIVFHSQDLHWNYFHNFVQNLDKILNTIVINKFSQHNYCLHFSLLFNKISKFATAITAAISEQGKTLDFLSKQHHFQLLGRRLNSAS